LVEHIYLQQRSSDGSVNITILKPWLALAVHRHGIFPDVKFCIAARSRLQSSIAYMISEKAVRFRHPDYDPDWAQKFISSSKGIIIYRYHFNLVSIINKLCSTPDVACVQ